MCTFIHISMLVEQKHAIPYIMEIVPWLHIQQDLIPLYSCIIIITALILNGYLGTCIYSPIIT